MRKKEEPSTARLSPLEVAVMNVVWDLGECSTREAIDAYNRRAERPLADTTIRTILATLRKKGAIEPVPTIERNLRIRPTVRRQSVAQRLFRQMISPLFGGSPSQAIAHLIRSEEISEEQIEEIRQMIDRLDQERKKS